MRVSRASLCLLALLAVPALAQDGEYEPLPKGTVNFAEHIAPLVFRKCGRCHGDNPSAPFSLTDYRSVREQGRVIGLVTKKGTMPPVLAESGYGNLANSGRLSAREIGLIDQWIKEGSAEGDADKTPPFPQPTGESSSEGCNQKSQARVDPGNQANPWNQIEIINIKTPRSSGWRTRFGNGSLFSMVRGVP